MTNARVSAIPKWTLVYRPGQGRGVYKHSDLGKSARIYKYMRATDLYSTLENASLWMTNVSNWDDPYEGWWCSQIFRPGTELSQAAAFGSCWTTRYLDEPFWRFYAGRCDHRGPDGALLPPPPPAVRIKATISRIVDVLKRVVYDNEAKAFVGRVRYRDTDQIKAEVGRIQRTETPKVAAVAARALHLKRRAYRFEREVRVLWIDRAGYRDHHSLGIDPLALIEEVMIGPAKDQSDVKTIRERLIALGYPMERIKSSGIYTTP